jgi:NAD(P)H dehydrogenase (quinone)
MRVAISGASGQLAHRAAELVLATTAPEDLVLTTRSPGTLASFAARGVAVRFADFADASSLRMAFAGTERLLLVSATDLALRAGQHRAALDAAKAAGVKHVVYTSGLRPEPPNPAVVAPSHHATEQALRQSGLGWTILRNSLYADFQLPEAKSALATGVLVHNRGRGAVAYVAREDCAAAAAAALLQSKYDGAVYDITGPARYDADELAALYAMLGGSPVQARAVHDTELIATLVGTATGDDHLRYGAELVASFGRSIREGYMDSCTHAVATLTSRQSLTLRQVLAPAFDSGA